MAQPEPPRVSIALPVRDAGPWIRECLDSLLAQTETNFEVLAVNDGSGDSSAQILGEYAARDPRIRVLEADRADLGIVAALNQALSVARSPYLARMDADDRMHPERLARQAAALDQQPTLFGVSCRATAFPDEALGEGMREYLDWQNALLTPQEIARDRFVESPVLHPSVMLRTEMVRERLGGWQDPDWPEDWDFFLRALQRGLPISRLRETLVYWRVHPRQLTQSHQRYSEDALLRARAHYLAGHLTELEHTTRCEDGARTTGTPEGDAPPPESTNSTQQPPSRPIWILGAGPVGKKLIKALSRCGVVASGLIDVDPRKIGGVVRGEGRTWKVVSHEDLRAMQPRPFAVSAVAGAGPRAAVRKELQSWGWSEGADFVVAA